MARVLVVDDNHDLAETLVLLLEAVGHEVRAVHDGRAALLEVERRLPDVVMLDIGLPHIDGVEVARRLREQYGNDVTLSAYTANADHATQRRIGRAGFDVVLTKPAPIERLGAAVGDWCPGQSDAYGLGRA
jgi:CheY-like chemotaxis protein